MFTRRRKGPWPPPPAEPGWPAYKYTIANIAEVVPGGIIRSGKTSWGSGTGFWLGCDPADDESKFDIGTPTDYFRYSETNGVQIAADGSTLTNIDGGNIQTETIIADSLVVGTLTFDRMISGSLSNNLIVNPAFEDGSAPHDLATDGDGTWSVQSTIKRGANALRYNPSGQTAEAIAYLNGNPTTSSYLYRHVTTFADKQYRFTFYGYRAAATTANTVRGYVRFYNAAGTLLNAYYTTFNPSGWSDDTWTECTTSKTAPAAAAYVVFAIAVRHDSETGDLYFDDCNARTMIGSGLLEADAVLAEHINVTNLQAVSTTTGALTVDSTLTMGANGIITWMSGAAKITDDYFDMALTASNRYAFRFLDGEAVHAYLAGYKSDNFTQLSIEVVGPAEDKYGQFAVSAIEFIDASPETVDFIVRSDTGVIFSALNYAATRIFQVDTMDSYFGTAGANCTKFATDGELTQLGTARTTVDAYITASGIKAPGSKPATFIEYGICGAWEFSEEIEANQESIAGTLKLPTQMDKTVAPVFKVGWSAAGSSPGNCEWQLEYLYRSPNEATNAAAQATLTATGTASATAEGLVITAFAALALPTATDQAMFFRLTRLSGHANDTIADTVELRGLLFTHTRNKLGTAT